MLGALTATSSHVVSLSRNGKILHSHLTSIFSILEGGIIGQLRLPVCYLGLKLCYRSLGGPKASVDICVFPRMCTCLYNVFTCMWGCMCGVCEVYVLCLCGVCVCCLCVVCVYMWHVCGGVLWYVLCL